VSGEHRSSYRRTFTPGERVDARKARFVASPSNLYPLLVTGGPGGCWHGGRIMGTFPPDRSWKYYHNPNRTALRFEVAHMVVEGVRIDLHGDALRPRGADFVIRGNHVTRCKDNAIENDRMLGGLSEDNLFDGVYQAYSARHKNEKMDGHDEVWTIRGDLVRLEAIGEPHHSESRRPGTGNFLKLSKGRSPKFVIEDVVWFAERQTDSEGGIGLSERAVVVRCRNNLLVYTGREPLDARRLGRDPETGASCFRVSHERGDWDRARMAWLARHPDLGP
jgi:hypothetical protein